MNKLKLLTAGILITILFSACASKVESRAISADDYSQNNYLKSPAEISAILAGPSVSSLNVLDIRTPDEFHSGCISGSKNIDFEAADFESKISQLDKNANYFVYCRSGRRSGLAVSKMRELGFKNLIELKGGINSWKSENQAVTMDCK